MSICCIHFSTLDFREQRQAEGSKLRELRFDSGHRRQHQADAPKKITDPEDEHVLRHGGKTRHVLERLVSQGRLVTEDFTEPGEAEEDARQHLHAPKCGIHGGWCIVLRSSSIHDF